MKEIFTCEPNPDAQSANPLIEAFYTAYNDPSAAEVDPEARVPKKSDTILINDLPAQW